MTKTFVEYRSKLATLLTTYPEALDLGGEFDGTMYEKSKDPNQDPAIVVTNLILLPPKVFKQARGFMIEIMKRYSLRPMVHSEDFDPSEDYWREILGYSEAIGLYFAACTAQVNNMPHYFMDEALNTMGAFNHLPSDIWSYTYEFVRQNSTWALTTLRKGDLRDPKRFLTELAAKVQQESNDSYTNRGFRTARDTCSRYMDALNWVRSQTSTLQEIAYDYLEADAANREELRAELLFEGAKSIQALLDAGLEMVKDHKGQLKGDWFAFAPIESEDEAMVAIQSILGKEILIANNIYDFASNMGQQGINELCEGLRKGNTDQALLTALVLLTPSSYTPSMLDHVRSYVDNHHSSNIEDFCTRRIMNVCVVILYRSGEPKAKSSLEHGAQLAKTSVRGLIANECTRAWACLLGLA